MKNIKLLDCTLRDGGRLFDCKFSDYEISQITDRLSKSNIDIIEIGFLRDPAKTSYTKNSTFFNDVSQMSRFIPRDTKTKYVAFADYGMFDPDLLPVCDGSSVTGLRVGFTKKNFNQEKEGVKKALRDVKSKGYELFIQGVNSLGYNDEEFVEVLEMVNEMEPFSFGIVDTYGSMFPEDVDRIYSLVDKHLNKKIALDFHAHNNKQLAFANSINVINLCKDRTLIIDGTLEGVGKCAGNLNLELIVNYLSDELGYNYDFDEILDTIDEFIRPLKNKYSWGYSVPALMGGLYKSHPNNIIYLFDKFRLSCKDFKNIISMIDKEKRQRYDYDDIERLYLEYSDSKIDDSYALERLKAKYENKKVLVKSPGHTLIDYKSNIDDYIKSNNPEVITVSYTESDFMCFVGNKRRYEKLIDKKHEGFVLTSNVKNKTDLEDELIVNYNSLIDRRYALYDNSVMMLLNLLKKLRVAEIAIAGFDGYELGKENYNDESFNNDRQIEKTDEINREISKMLRDFIDKVNPEIKIELITPSLYEGTE